MNLLLDSHALIWAVDEPSLLSPAAALAIQDPANELFLTKCRKSVGDRHQGRAQEIGFNPSLQPVDAQSDYRFETFDYADHH